MGGLLGERGGKGYVGPPSRINRGGGGGWPPGPPLPTPMQSTQHLLFFRYSLLGYSISRERERRERELIMKITMRRERERERCGTSRCTERSEVKDKRQKLMRISWERERELTNILNKKMLKYHFLSCIYIYISNFRNFFTFFSYIFLQSQ